MVRQVALCVEVAGCPTICQHCWAQGVPYRAMHVSDIGFVLEQTSAVCASVGLPFRAFPMHEVAAHPQAREVLRLFSSYPGNAASDGGQPMFEPLSTTGVPLALRSDWAEVLATCRELGTTVVWPAVHGWGATHDRMVHRAGAYQETLLGIDRVRAAGLEVGCNVFLTRENVGQFDALVADLLAHGVAQFAIAPATYLPTARSRRYEAQRPALADLLPLVERVQALPSPTFHCAEWADLAAHTEAAHVRRALAGDWPVPSEPIWDEITLVCRPNLDLYWGLAGHYRRRYGNLRRDNVPQVVRAALADEGGATDALWFTLTPIPAVHDLAACYGDPEGDGVHFREESIRRRWLDLAQQDQRRHGSE